MGITAIGTATNSRRDNPLKNEHEEDLHWFFGNGLAVDGGARSTIGAQLEALKWKLPDGGGGNEPFRNHDIIVRAVERERRVRVFLGRLEPWQVEVLKSAYGEIAQQSVWGLVGTFGIGEHHTDGKETAAIAVAMREVDAPGASQWDSVAKLVRRASNGSSKAKTELKELVDWTHRALQQARSAYRRAERGAWQEAREIRSERSAGLMELVESLH